MAADLELGCDGPRTLVVGVDGSDTATRALYYALGLARRQHCSVIAVYAMTTPAGYDGAMGAAPYQASLELAEELKPKIQALAADYHVKTEFVSVPGDPVTVLIKIAAAHHAERPQPHSVHARSAHSLYGSGAWVNGSGGGAIGF